MVLMPWLWLVRRCSEGHCLNSSVVSSAMDDSCTTAHGFWKRAESVLSEPLASLPSPAIPVASYIPLDSVLSGCMGCQSILQVVFFRGGILVVPLFPAKTHTGSLNAELFF